MSITKVWICDGCISCGECEEICPEVFIVTDECHINKDADITKYAEQIKESALACPVEVIRYEE